MRLLNRGQAARRLGMPERTVYALTKAGRLPTIKVGRVNRYDEETLHRWLEEQTTNTPEREPEPLHTTPMDVPQLEEVRSLETRVLVMLVSEARELRRLVARIGNKLIGGAR